MGTIRENAFDSERPPALARFWAAVFDRYQICGNDDAEIARLCSLGASVFRRADGYTGMQDPEGNEFCIVPVAPRDAAAR